MHVKMYQYVSICIYTFNKTGDDTGIGGRGEEGREKEEVCMFYSSSSICERISTRYCSARLAHSSSLTKWYNLAAS